MGCRSSAHIRRDLKGASGQSHSLMKNSRRVTSDVVKRPNHPKEIRRKTRAVLFSRSFQEWRSRFSPSSYDCARSVRAPQGRADCIGDVRQQCICKCNSLQRGSGDDSGIAYSRLLGFRVVRSTRPCTLALSTFVQPLEYCRPRQKNHLAKFPL